jgi:DNA-nicking Smr family endonuclease
MNRPFAILEDWVKQGRIRLSADPVVDEPKPTPMELLPDDLPDEQLFAFAMRDVKSLGWSAVPLHNRPPTEIQAQDDEQDALRALEEFVRNGNVEIEQTAEYIEGSVHPQGRLYLDDLRSGRFSVQAYVDLHGLNLQEARFVLDEFLLESVRAGFTCVRVIHGRGRHSHKHHPVLKENIQRWLCTRRLGRHVIAYTSARRCDGGGGAVYVLLRK